MSNALLKVAQHVVHGYATRCVSCKDYDLALICSKRAFNNNYKRFTTMKKSKVNSKGDNYRYQVVNRAKLFTERDLESTPVRVTGYQQETLTTDCWQRRYVIRAR